MQGLDRQLHAPIERATSYVEIVLRLSSVGSPPGSSRPTPEGTAPPTMVVIDPPEVHGGSLPLLRSVQPAPNLLLVVGSDREDRVRFSTTVPDPLLIRAEFPDENGQLEGRVIARDNAEVVVRVPADPSIETVELFRSDVQEDGVRYVLIGSVPVGS